MTTETQQDGWRFPEPSRAASVEELLDELRLLEQYFGGMLVNHNSLDRHAMIWRRGVEVELSLILRLRCAIQSGDALRLRRVLWLVVHRSHWKPTGSHVFVKPTYTLFSKCGVDLGNLPRPSCARRLGVFTGCLLAFMSGIGAIAAAASLVISLSTGQWMLTVILVAVTLTGWLGTTLYRLRLPRDLPRRFRQEFVSD